MTYIDPKQSVSTKEKLEWLTPKIYELRSKQTESSFSSSVTKELKEAKYLDPLDPQDLGQEWQVHAESVTCSQPLLHHL